MLTMVGVVVAESPSPDPSASAPESQEPSAAVAPVAVCRSLPGSCRA